MTEQRRKLAAIAAFVALCVIWSSTWLAIKFGLRDLPPISFVAIRFVIAVAVLPRFPSGASRSCRGTGVISGCSPIPAR